MPTLGQNYLRNKLSQNKRRRHSYVNMEFIESTTFVQKRGFYYIKCHRNQISPYNCEYFLDLFRKKDVLYLKKRLKLSTETFILNNIRITIL